MNDGDASSSIQVRGSPSSGASARVPGGQSASLDDYEIIREIGRGGTAIVYEAYHKSLRRKVALKQLPAAAALDPRWQERFQNEVRATSRLSHPNIVPFYQLGRDEDSYFYTMQLIDGISLAEVIRRLRQCREGNRPCMKQEADAVHPAFLKLCNRCRCGFACRPAESNDKPTDLPASPEYHEVVGELMFDTALAVQHAHDQGILHLDIKPSNILIDGEGKVWVTDFGAARNNDAAVSDSLSGTLCYASPEQVCGRDDQIDVRSDVYSLGATLYELLTLERPFADVLPHVHVAQVSLGNVKDPAKVNNAVPRELTAIINKAMAREQDQRHATVGQLSDDLEAYLAPPTKFTLTEGRHAALRLGRVIGAVFVIVVMIAIVVVAPWRTRSPNSVFTELLLSENWEAETVGNHLTELEQWNSRGGTGSVVNGPRGNFLRLDDFQSPSAPFSWVTSRDSFSFLHGNKTVVEADITLRDTAGRARIGFRKVALSQARYLLDVLDGEVQLHKLVGGGVSGEIGSAAFEPGPNAERTYRLQVTHNGDNIAFQVFADGNLLFSVDDTTPILGTSDPFNLQLTTISMEADFDNITLDAAPEPSTLTSLHDRGPDSRFRGMKEGQMGKIASCSLHRW